MIINKDGAFFYPTIENMINFSVAKNFFSVHVLSVAEKEYSYEVKPRKSGHKSGK
jgi:hypothetical protein